MDRSEGRTYLVKLCQEVETNHVLIFEELGGLLLDLLLQVGWVEHVGQLQVAVEVVLGEINCGDVSRVEEVEEVPDDVLLVVKAK